MFIYNLFNDVAKLQSVDRCCLCIKTNIAYTHSGPLVIFSHYCTDVGCLFVKEQVEVIKKDLSEPIEIIADSDGYDTN